MPVIEKKQNRSLLVDVNSNRSPAKVDGVLLFNHE
jgi:hypothetical protein